MTAIKAAIQTIKACLRPPEDMDNATFVNRLKYNFTLIREAVKAYFIQHKLESLSAHIREHFRGDGNTPAGEYISDEELERPSPIILMDERGRLRQLEGLAGANISGKKLTSVGVDQSTLIYFGGVGNRAAYPNVVEMDSHYQNRIGSTANTWEKIILPAYDNMGLDDPTEPKRPKKDRLRNLGITATYVYAYHSHGLGLESYSEDDVYLRTLLWDYELLRLRQNPEGYFGREEQLFVENVFLPRIAKEIAIEDGKFVRNPETGRIIISGTYDTEWLMRNCRFTLVGYSLGADVIHRLRNCLVAYLRDLYPDATVRRALQQVVAVTSCGANPSLKDAPNFTIIRCVDIHDFGTLCRNPSFYLFPWWDLTAGTYRAVYMNPNELMCWMRTPYRDADRINIGYHDEKFCLSPDYFPEIARNAIIKSASYNGILPKSALTYITSSALNQANKTVMVFDGAKAIFMPKLIAVIMLILMVMFALIANVELIPAFGG